MVTEEGKAAGVAMEEVMAAAGVAMVIMEVTVDGVMDTETFTEIISSGASG